MRKGSTCLTRQRLGPDVHAALARRAARVASLPLGETTICAALSASSVYPHQCEKENGHFAVAPVFRFAYTRSDLPLNKPFACMILRTGWRIRCRLLTDTGRMRYPIFMSVIALRARATTATNTCGAGGACAH